MTTMLDKCAVAGDITQALDRRGVWTCAITVIGGTESTAVKLQSCETASGSFTDFKTLIPASEASADQYKGFVVDLHGAKKFIKVVGATMATAVFGDCDHDIKDVAIKAGEVPSSATLEDNKTASIDVSDYTEAVEIEPSENYDGMKKATVTLSNIPQIEANKAQSIDVSQYTEPVEIEPTSPNDAMAKATVTLSNIPSPSSSATAYAWQGSVGDMLFTDFENAPSTLSDEKELLPILLDGKVASLVPTILATEEDVNYSKISDTSFGAFGETFTRDSTKDFTLWQTE